MPAQVYLLAVVKTLLQIELRACLGLSGVQTGVRKSTMPGEREWKDMLLDARGSGDIVSARLAAYPVSSLHWGFLGVLAHMAKGATPLFDRWFFFCLFFC